MRRLLLLFALILMMGILGANPQTELACFKSRPRSPDKKHKQQEATARLHLELLIKGGTDKQMEEALAELTQIHKQLNITDPLEDWYRTLAGYDGIVFKDVTAELGLADLQHFRIAIADYDNDGWLDLLFDGCHLYRNEEGLRFADVTDSVGLTEHHASCGVWADFNQDGYLDFASTSYDGDGRGDSLMKNHQNQRFYRVNERAGDIADGIPSLSAAWIDIDGKGFPSLYVEKSTEQGGYYNMFWHNTAGYFTEGDQELSAKAAEIIIQQHFANTDNWDELKGSRMYSAPLWADFDNDGLMDLFVNSLYETERRYLYRNNGDGSFTDVSFLSGVWKYDSWGYACGDLNRDGMVDLVVGSGNGTRVLYNVTDTPNKSLFVKPVWQDGEIVFLDDPALYPQRPNSPAYGTKVAVTLTMPDGSQNTLMRELNSTFGSYSQNAPELHFGLGQASTWYVERAYNEED